MAGIGLRLERLLSGKTYSEKAKAYIYAAFMSCGPWLFPILTLSLISLFSTPFLRKESIGFLRLSIVYIFALSLVITGPFQLPLIRYLADELYTKRKKFFLPTFNAAFLSVLMLQVPLLVILFIFSSFSLQLKIELFIIYFSVLGILISMLFLEAATDYVSIAFWFLAGAVVAVASSFLLGKKFGLLGYEGGLSLGFFITFLGLISRIILEFPSPLLLKFSFLKYFKVYFPLILAGAFYNLGIWIDKLIFWLHPETTSRVSGVFFASMFYDAPIFLSWLTVVPSFIYIFLVAETSFYRKYRDFYARIMKRHTFGHIHHEFVGIIDIIKRTTFRLTELQGFISLIVIFLAPQITKALGLSQVQIHILRFGTLGAFFQILFLSLYIVLMYFAFYRLLAFLSFLYFSLNGIFTYFSILLGPSYWGMGYAISCFVCFAVSYLIIAKSLKSFEYITFMGQPIPLAEAS